MNCVATALALLALVAFNEAFNDAPAPAPGSIYDLLTCIGPPIRNQSTEYPPLIHLTPVPQHQEWKPADGSVPLYYEDYETIFDDTTLRDRLIAHIGPEIYANSTEPITLILRDPPRQSVPSDHPLLDRGCRGLTLTTLYPDITNIQLPDPGFFSDYDCDASPTWAELRPYYFPPYLPGVQCTNVFQNPFSTCSIPGGAICVVNQTCNYNAPMLMWDCCWTWVSSQSTFDYACGWRRVFVPVATGCLCSC